MNINALRTKITDLSRDYSRKLNELQQGAVIISNKEMTGIETVLTAPFNFGESLKEIEILGATIAEYKGTLATVNSTTKIGVGDHTIHTAIASLTELRALYNKIDYILNNSKERKNRKDAGYGSSAASYFELVTLNFNKDELIARRQTLQLRINELEEAIAKANASTEVVFQ